MLQESKEPGAIYSQRVLDIRAKKDKRILKRAHQNLPYKHELHQVLFEDTQTPSRICCGIQRGPQYDYRGHKIYTVFIAHSCNYNQGRFLCSMC